MSARQNEIGTHSFFSANARINSSPLGRGVFIALLLEFLVFAIVAIERLTSQRAPHLGVARPTPKRARPVLPLRTTRPAAERTRSRRVP